MGKATRLILLFQGMPCLYTPILAFTVIFFFFFLVFFFFLPFVKEGRLLGLFLFIPLSLPEFLFLFSQSQVCWTFEAARLFVFSLVCLIFVERGRLLKACSSGKARNATNILIIMSMYQYYALEGNTAPLAFLRDSWTPRWVLVLWPSKKKNGSYAYLIGT